MTTKLLNTNHPFHPSPEKLSFSIKLPTVKALPKYTQNERLHLCKLNWKKYNKNIPPTK